MPGFFNHLVLRQGTELPQWQDEDAVTQFFDGIIEAGRESCELAEQCALRGIVKRFSLIEMAEGGQQFDRGVVLEAHCYADECPNPRQVLEPLRIARSQGAVLYNTGMASRPRE
jgi:hypothetical protein